jgi:hypothetical protein
VRVRIYVEGGPKGTHADGLRRFKNGFKQHLARLDPRLSTLDVSPCGSTEETIRDFARALREQKPDCIVALLVDSDTPVIADTPAIHLQSKLDSAKVPQNARANIFMMVQCMEAWLVTDGTALEKCFGDKLRAGALPTNPDIEAVSKRDVLAALDAAVKPTPIGRYHKVEHGAKILANLDPDRVGVRSRHARNLQAFLRNSSQY